ncbi:GH23422 [Drosophila grimshawi]|uniref:GH23422 n=1 Tax=Drosophila grimshawi TaxID=7222 RepID=B4K463_DROGR|nr:GH23422 [Drosophila grimshawi]
MDDEGTGERRTAKTDGHAILLLLLMMVFHSRSPGLPLYVGNAGGHWGRQVRKCHNH